MNTDNPMDRLFVALAEEHLDELVASYCILAAMERLDTYFQQMSIKYHGNSPYRTSHVKLIIMKKNLMEHMRESLETLEDLEVKRDA